MARRLPRGWRRIAHLRPYRLNNSHRGRRLAKRLGYRQIDQDCQVTKDGHPVVTHGALIRKDRMVRQDGSRWPRNTHVQDLTLAQVRQLRSRPGGYRIQTVEEAMAECKRLGLVMCLEVKSDPRFGQEAVWRRIAAAQRRTGCQVRVMTLQNLGNALPRLRQAKAHGFTTILLCRGRQPSPWSAWEPHVDYLRGRWTR